MKGIINLLAKEVCMRHAQLALLEGYKLRSLKSSRLNAPINGENLNLNQPCRIVQYQAMKVTRPTDSYHQPTYKQLKIMGLQKE